MVGYDSIGMDVRVEIGVTAVCDGENRGGKERALKQRDK